MEDLLKSGELPCLVATSSLELGIDMGAVDLVIQVESPSRSPPGPADRPGRPQRGRRRLARAHLPQVPRRPARVVVAKRDALRRHRATPWFRATSSTCSPSRSSQWPLPATSSRSRRCTRPSAAPTRSPELSRELLDSVLDMLDGRYPSEEFAELRPRIVWDRVEDTIRARKGARQLAVTNAGTIPDRGLYGVHLPDGARGRARRGDGLRGPARADLPARRLDLADRGNHPRPGDRHAGLGRARRRSFWRRAWPKELGEAIGAFSREAVDRDPAGCGRLPGRARRAQPVRVPARAARRHARGTQRPH